MLNNFLSGEQGNSISGESDFQKFVIKNSIIHSSQVNFFHIDCKFTNRKVCYCDYNKDSLISKKHDSQLVADLKYLQNRYKGVEDQDYYDSYRRLSLFKEKIRYSQKKIDVFHHIPKFSGILQSESEKFQEFQIKAVNQTVDVVEGDCYYCKTRFSQKFYQIHILGLEQQVCEDCTHRNHPDSIPKPTLEQILFHRRGKPPKHLRHLKELYLQKKREREEQRKKERAIRIQNGEQVADDQNGQDPMNEKLYEEDFEIALCQSKDCKAPDDQQNMLTCKKCQRSYHAHCCDPPLEKQLVSRFEWNCTDCKLCIICVKNQNEDELLICDCCDRAFHISCHIPKQKEIPEGKWFCMDCDKCPSCQIKLFSAEDNVDKCSEKFQTYLQQIYQNKIVCDDCTPYFSEKSFCPMCLRVIKEDSEGNFVFCDTCEQWVHSECEKMNVKNFKEISQQQSFVCSRCKSKTQAE